MDRGFAAAKKRRHPFGRIGFLPDAPGFVLGGLGLCALALALAGSVQGGWSDVKLERYLNDGHRQDGLVIQELTVQQAGVALPAFVQTGREEKRRNLRERPILAPAVPEGPFSRFTQFVFRVNRARDIRIVLSLEYFSRAGNSGSLRRSSVEEVWARLGPGFDWETLHGSKGRFQLLIPRTLHCGQAVFEYGTRAGQHRIRLLFLNQKLPVTLPPGGRE